MKTALFLALVILSQNAFAAGKEHACNVYLASVQDGDSQAVQLVHIVDAMNAGFELGYTPEQSHKLLVSFKNIIAQDSSKFNAISNAAYFACVTDLTSEDKATARQQYETIINHLTN